MRNNSTIYLPYRAKTSSVKSDAGIVSADEIHLTVEEIVFSVKVRLLEIVLFDKIELSEIVLSEKNELSEIILFDKVIIIMNRQFASYFHHLTKVFTFDSFTCSFV